MHPQTFEALPADVKEFVGRQVDLDPSIPIGTVRIPVNDFVRQRRAARKRQRQNKKQGRRK